MPVTSDFDRYFDTSLPAALGNQLTLQRPTSFIPVNAVAIAAEATLWDPAVGKRVRLLGGLLSSTVAAFNVTLKNGNGGATIFMLPNTLVGVAYVFNIPYPGLLLDVDANLRAIGTTAQVLNGTLWGREE